MNIVEVIQTETTYEVSYEGYDYTVTSTENLQEGYLDWEVFDDNGNLVMEEDEGLHNEIVAFLIQNI